MANIQDKKNAVFVVISNLMTIFINIILCLFLPMIIDVENYALYKVYVLYATYNGLFHFGFINSIYLKYGSYDYEDLPKETFRYYHRVMIAISSISYLILGIMLFTLSINNDMDTVVALFFVALNIPVLNIRCYYSIINQCTKMFIRDSYVVFMQNILTLIMVLSVWLFEINTYIYILIFTTLINIISALCTILQNKTLYKGEWQAQPISELVVMIKNGSVFMLSEYISLIIIGLDSIFIDFLFSNKEFAMYSFAATIIAGIYALLSVISNLMYPYLVRVRGDKLPNYYNKISNILAVVTAVFMSTFFVIKVIIEKFIPSYIPSIKILSILYGVILFRVLLQLVGCNYFKTLNLTKEYCRINVISIVIAFISNCIAYILFKNYVYIALASLLTFVVWYIITELYLMKKLEIPLKKGVFRYFIILFTLIIFYMIV